MCGVQYKAVESHWSHRWALCILKNWSSWAPQCEMNCLMKNYQVQAQSSLRPNFALPLCFCRSWKCKGNRDDQWRNWVKGTAEGVHRSKWLWRWWIWAKHLRKKMILFAFSYSKLITAFISQIYFKSVNSVCSKLRICLSSLACFKFKIQLLCVGFKAPLSHISKYTYISL